jgi:uncharacterized protein YndB with AHSA1/START domain
MTLPSAPRAVRFHRVVRCPPQHLYRAFLEPAAMCKWLPPHGFTAQSLHSDVRVGGAHRMSFTNFRTGATHAFGGVYLELTPPSPAGDGTPATPGRIRYTDKFDDPNLPGEMRVTVEFVPVMCGTELQITQEGIPEQVPLEFCYLGWQESLTMLANLVEPEIP